MGLYIKHLAESAPRPANWSFSLTAQFNRVLDAAWAKYQRGVRAGNIDDDDYEKASASFIHKFSAWPYCLRLKDLKLLLLYSFVLQHLHVEACNRELTDAEETAARSAREALADLAGRINRSDKDWDGTLKFTVNEDPRGFAISIHTGEENPPHNSFGGAECGYGVPKPCL